MYSPCLPVTHLFSQVNPFPRRTLENPRTSYFARYAYAHKRLEYRSTCSPGCTGYFALAESGWCLVDTKSMREIGTCPAAESGQLNPNQIDNCQMVGPTCGPIFEKVCWNFGPRNLTPPVFAKAYVLDSYSPPIIALEFSLIQN